MESSRNNDADSVGIDDADKEDLGQRKIEFSNSKELVMTAFIKWLQLIDGSNNKEKDAKE